MRRRGRRGGDGSEEKPELRGTLVRRRRAPRSRRIRHQGSRASVPAAAIAQRRDRRRPRRSRTPNPRTTEPSKTIGSLVEEWFVARTGRGDEDSERRSLALGSPPRASGLAAHARQHRAERPPPLVATLRNPDPTSRYADGTRMRAISGPTAHAHYIHSRRSTDGRCGKVTRRRILPARPPRSRWLGSAPTSSRA